MSSAIAIIPRIPSRLSAKNSGPRWQCILPSRFPPGMPPPLRREPASPPPRVGYPRGHRGMYCTRPLHIIACFIASIAHLAEARLANHGRKCIRISGSMSKHSHADTNLSREPHPWFLVLPVPLNLPTSLCKSYFPWRGIASRARSDPALLLALETSGVAAEGCLPTVAVCSFWSPSVYRT